jgi:ABC-type transport system involved in cytochrome c biogenesis permease subunit
MHSPLFDACLGLYAASLAAYIGFLYGEKRLLGKIAPMLLGAAIVVHYLALMERSRWMHSVPYNDLYGSMSLFAWLVAVTYLVLEMWYRQPSVGAVVLPFLLAWEVALAIATPATPPPVSPGRGAVLAFHITLGILGYAAFALSFILSLIFILQSRMLRARRPGRAFWRFPPLDVLARMSRGSIWVGLAACGASLVFGFIWDRRIRGSFSLGDPKVIFTFAILVLYGMVLWLGGRASWRGPRVARFCALCFLLVLFSYTLVNLYLTGFHKYF